jgi:anaerobic selenocysteine-containing dehydrogenase
MLNETAAMADWVLPVLSPLEAWGDYEPWTGTHCLMQPTMGSLHDAWHSGDVFLTLAAMYGHPFEQAGQRITAFRQWLMVTWRQLHERIAPDREFEAFWEQSLRNGGAFEERTGTISDVRPAVPVSGPLDVEQPLEAVPAEGLHLWLWPSILLFDGRLANRGWMQEIPERMSTLAWGSWVDISPATAH